MTNIDGQCSIPKIGGMTRNREAVYSLDPKGKFVAANLVATELTGYDAEELLGKNPVRLIVTEDRRRAAEHFSEALRGEPQNYEVGIKRKDGCRVELHVTQVPIVVDGEVVSVYGIAKDITESKRVYARLLESERRLSTLLSNAPGYLYRCRNEPNRPNDEFVSDYAFELTGYTPKELTDGSVLFGDLVVEEDRKRIWEEVQGALGRGERFELRYAIRCRDGEIRHVEERGQGVYRESGQVEAIEGVVYDVTERVRVEERLREAETRYRSLVENVPAVTYIQEPGLGKAATYTVTYMSPRVEDVLGYAPRKFMEDPEFWNELIHREDLEGVIAEDARTEETGEPFRMEYRMTARDGRVVWIRDEAVLIRNPKGEPLYWQGVLSDVTERYEAQQRFRSSFRDAAIGMALVAPDGRWLQVNRALCGIVGYPEEELLNKTFQDITYPDDLDADLDNVRRMLTGEIQTYQMEKRYLHKEGHPVWVLLSVSLVRDAWGSPLYFISQVQDITERKEAERKLQEAETRYRTLVERVPAIVYIEALDGDMTTLYDSPQIENILGYPQDMHKKDPNYWLKIIHPEDKDRVLAAERRAAAKAEPFQEEYRVVARDGRVVWVRDETVIVRDEEGQLFWHGIIYDVTVRKRMEEELAYQALHDSLTGLPNRNLFLDRLEHALARAGRAGKKVAVLFMDLDNFKYVNDSLGHEAGDWLLVEVAQRLRGHFRPGDTVSRLGGDEFVVLLEDVRDVTEAEQAAARVTKEMETPFTLGGGEVFATASVGIAVSTPGRAHPEDLLREADLAMYGAKASGKDRHEVFDVSMNAAAHTRLELEGDLRRAVEREEFVLHYQPKVLPESGEVAGFEALLRWEHPKKGLVPPAEFVPLAEETGLIVRIGRWVLREACRQGKEWQKLHSGESPLAMSVNLSARQLHEPGLVTDVSRALSDTGLPPLSLILEITESTLIEQAPKTMALLQELKTLGIRFAIDDFGTGYSSLSYLEHLPVDILKVDRSFVARLGQDDAKGRALVSAVTDLARALGLEVVAEGVETAEQLERLLELGCDLAQGYHFAKPLPSEAVSKLLQMRPQRI